MSADIHTLVGAYALDAVAALDRARLDRPRAEWGRCARGVAERRATAGRLAEITELAPPARLKDAVLAQVARTRQVGAGRPAGGRGPEVRWRRWTAVAVAAGIIAVGAGAATFAVENQRGRDARSQAAQAQQVADVLDAPDAVGRTQDVA